MFIDLKSSPKYIGRSEIVTSYLEEIRKFPVLNMEEEQEIFKNIKNGDNSARNKIIQCNQRFVFAIAKRYATNETNLLDIINEGNIGLIKAIDSFDINLGYKFTTYAIWYITREINYYLNNSENIIYKSNSTKTNKKIQKIKNDFFLKNGYYPSNNEICNIFQEKYNYKIIDNRDLYDLTVDSINMTASDDDDSFTVENSRDFVSKSSTNNSFVKKEDDEYNAFIVNKLLSNLSEKEEIIIKLLYGIDYDRSYEINEISHILNMSSERVRQIKHAVIDKLHKMLQTYDMAI